MFSEKPKIVTGPKIDTFNKNYTRQGGKVKVKQKKFRLIVSKFFLRYLVKKLMWTLVHESKLKI